jgi:Protein kinase domain
MASRRAGSTSLSGGDENPDMGSTQSLAGDWPPPEDEGAIHGPLGVIAAPAATPAINGYSLPEPQKGTHVETSPQGRYLRFEEKLGSGQYKDVYRAYDTSEGIEVAWNTVNIKLLPKEEKKRIMNEVRLLQNLEHKNLVQFHGSWVNREKEQVLLLILCNLFNLGNYMMCIALCCQYYCAVHLIEIG